MSAVILLANVIFPNLRHLDTSVEKLLYLMKDSGNFFL